MPAKFTQPICTIGVGRRLRRWTLISVFIYVSLRLAHYRPVVDEALVYGILGAVTGRLVRATG
jgi:hypothetical protein